MKETTRAEYWHPIYTAPQGSAAILVWCPERQNIYVVTWWDNGNNGPGWVHFGGLGGSLMEMPTMWQPLPLDPLA
jgi:hypothetical protein